MKTVMIICWISAGISVALALARGAVLIGRNAAGPDAGYLDASINRNEADAPVNIRINVTLHDTATMTARIKAFAVDNGAEVVKETWSWLRLSSSSGVRDQIASLHQAEGARLSPGYKEWAPEAKPEPSDDVITYTVDVEGRRHRKLVLDIGGGMLGAGCILTVITLTLSVCATADYRNEARKVRPA